MREPIYKVYYMLHGSILFYFDYCLLKPKKILMSLRIIIDVTIMT